MAATLCAHGEPPRRGRGQRDAAFRYGLRSRLRLNSPELLDRLVTAKPRVAELLTAPSALDLFVVPGTGGSRFASQRRKLRLRRRGSERAGSTISTAGSPRKATLSADSVAVQAGRPRRGGAVAGRRLLQENSLI